MTQAMCMRATLVLATLILHVSCGSDSQPAPSDVTLPDDAASEPDSVAADTVRSDSESPAPADVPDPVDVPRLADTPMPTDSSDEGDVEAHLDNSGQDAGATNTDITAEADAPDEQPLDVETQQDATTGFATDVDAAADAPGTPVGDAEAPDSEGAPPACQADKIAFPQDNPQQYEFYELCVTAGGTSEATLQAIDPSLYCGVSGFFADCEGGKEVGCHGDLAYEAPGSKAISDDHWATLCALSAIDDVRVIAGGHWL